MALRSATEGEYPGRAHPSASRPPYVACQVQAEDAVGIHESFELGSRWRAGVGRQATQQREFRYRVEVAKLNLLDVRGLNGSLQHCWQLTLSVVTIRGGPLRGGVSRAAGGRPLGLARGCCRSGAAEAPGSRPAAGRRAAMCSSLEAGGAAPYAARHPREVSGGAQPPPSSGGVRGQHLVQRPGGGFPAQGLAGPAVQLGGDRLQPVPAVHGQVGALGEVLAQQPVSPNLRLCSLADSALTCGLEG